MNDITKMNLIAIVQQLPNEDIEFIQTCITMLENKITNLQKEKDKYKNVIDKIKEWVLYQQQSNENLEPYISTDKLDDILELLEEVE